LRDIEAAGGEHAAGTTLSTRGRGDGGGEVVIGGERGDGAAPARPRLGFARASHSGLGARAPAGASTGVWSGWLVSWGLVWLGAPGPGPPGAPATRGDSDVAVPCCALVPLRSQSQRAWYLALLGLFVFSSKKKNFQKNATIPITSNLTIYAWSIKYR